MRWLELTSCRNESFPLPASCLNLTNTCVIPQICHQTCVTIWITLRLFTTIIILQFIFIPSFLLATIVASNSIAVSCLPRLWKILTTWTSKSRLYVSTVTYRLAFTQGSTSLDHTSPLHSTLLLHCSFDSQFTCIENSAGIPMTPTAPLQYKAVNAFTAVLHTATLVIKSALSFSCTS